MIDVYIIETLKVLDAMDGDPNAMIFARSQFRKLAKAEGLRDAAKMGRLVSSAAGPRCDWVSRSVCR